VRCAHGPSAFRRLGLGVDAAASRGRPTDGWAPPPGDELVEAPFERPIAAGRLHAVRYQGFWGPLDTLRDLEDLEVRAAAGQAQWMAWEERP